MRIPHPLPLLSLSLTCLTVVAQAEPIALGSRLELLTDEMLVAEIRGDLDHHLHQPEPREVVLTADAPWEGNTSGYFTLFQDGDLYRMYYRGWAHDPATQRELRSEVTCYAESDDGIRWRKPELGLHDFEGSKANNIILRDGDAVHNFTPFKDTNPNCPPESRYKALGSAAEKSRHGLIYFRSADGIHWVRDRSEPLIVAGAFDSQNLAFWDGQRGEYRAYWRIFTDGVADGREWKPKGFRAIRTATSQDFLTWEPHHDVQYAEGVPDQHLYTNAVLPHPRAPHLFIGFPTRYLPDEGHRVEPVLMTSRDGLNFVRHAAPVIPESAPADRKGNRSNYMAWGLLSLPGKPDELSVYATEAYLGTTPGRLRRFVYRLDGFVSLRAPVDGDGGEMVTKPLTFTGDRLVVNVKPLSEAGSVRVALLDESGKALPGFSLEDAVPITRDATGAVVAWQSQPDLAALAGQPVRLRIALREADLFSIQFTSESQ